MIWAAHLVTTGVGAFYDGAAHFFVSFEELLPVVALSLLAGLRGPRVGRWSVAILPVSWLLGAAIPLAGLLAPAAPAPPLATTVLLLVPGLLAAWDRQLPLGVVAAAAIGFGLWLGFVNGATMAAGELGLRGVLGAASAALLVATLLTAFVSTLRAGWRRVAARVAGSWLAALGLLALGWSLQGRTP